jgi:hypothetical protein
LPIGFEEKYEQCKKCKGKGGFEGANFYKEVKGDWVEGTSRTIKKLRSSGGYYYETTNTPGYYKPSKTVSPGKGAFTNCKECRGKGGFTSGWREHLFFDSRLNTYITNRVNIN